jgi:hypothetical protein
MCGVQSYTRTGALGSTESATRATQCGDVRSMRVLRQCSDRVQRIADDRVYVSYTC